MKDLAERSIADAAPPATSILSIDQVWQEMDQWCWAACSVMIFNYYFPGHSTDKCTLASWQTGYDCCPNPSSSYCNVPCQPPEVVNLLYYHGVSCTPNPASINPDDLRGEIDQQRPVGVGLNLSNGSGHMILVRGYSTGTSYFYVNDPYKGEGWVDYATIVAGYGGGTWYYTFLQILPRTV